jgi:hypothetical protein
MRGQVLGLFWTNKIVLNGMGSQTTGSTGIIGSINGEAMNLSRSMKGALLNLKSDHMNAAGTAVDYKSLKNSPSYNEFVVKTKELQSIDVLILNEYERKAFFLNIYNCLVIHGVAENQFKKGLLGEFFDRLQFYASMSYNIGGNVLSLNDIEHGILRGNRLPPTPFGSPVLPKDSPLPLSCDARIHFALNCGAMSCPPIFAYSGSKDELNSELDLACESFIENNVKIIDDKHVELSMVRMMYTYCIYLQFILNLNLSLP